MDSPERKYCYKYPHPALTADCVIFGFDGESLKVLLVERGIEPFKGLWALPGGFVNIDETVEHAAARELREETGLTNVFMQQFRVFSKVDRDPRERVVTVAFIALVRPSAFVPIAGDDAANALWFDERHLPPMAFDHCDIIEAAREFLSEKLRTQPVAFQLLDKMFTLSELQRIYEVINRTSYDRRNFQRKALQSGLITEASPSGSECRASAPGRTAPRESTVGRPPRKLFWFSDRGKKRSDEGSTKDLFDF